VERLDTIEELAAHHGCGLVPTMGALHRGHCSLIEAMRRETDDVVVSVFVNPAQFNDPADLDRYPRTLDADLAAAEAAGATAVFTPPIDTIYPKDRETWQPPLPRVATAPKLEDACRPGHFAGVCGVVARLFDLARPAKAVFGEKDWQQMLVLEAMVAEHPDRWGALQLLRGATIRDPDGLALSSRNALLSPEHRERALGVSRALAVAGDGETAMQAVLDDHGLETGYAVIRDATTLEATQVDRPVRALIAAGLEGIRLIDNDAC